MVFKYIYIIYYYLTIINFTGLQINVSLELFIVSIIYQNMDISSIYFLSLILVSAIFTIINLVYFFIKGL